MSTKDDIAAILREHEIDLSALRRDKATEVGYWMACRCGFEWTPCRTMPADNHLEHVAESIASHLETL